MNKKFYSSLHGSVILFASYLLVYSVFAMCEKSDKIANIDELQQKVEELPDVVES